MDTIKTGKVVKIGGNLDTCLEYDLVTYRGVLELIDDCAHGIYQRNLLRGIETWSGSSLGGTAGADRGASYANSRRNLLRRINTELSHVDLIADTDKVFDTFARRWRVELVIYAVDTSEDAMIVNDDYYR